MIYGTKHYWEVDMYSDWKKKQNKSLMILNDKPKKNKQRFSMLKQKWRHVWLQAKMEIVQLPANDQTFHQSDGITVSLWKTQLVLQAVADILHDIISL